MMRQPGTMAGRPMRGGPEVQKWARWQNWANLVLGLLLFISPWVVGTASLLTAVYARAACDAWIVGVLIMLVAIWALAMPRMVIPEWCNIILGAWLFISPWVLGYAALTGAAWTSWIIGILVVIMAAWAFSAARRVNMQPGM